MAAPQPGHSSLTPTNLRSSPECSVNDNTFHTRRSSGSPSSETKREAPGSISSQDGTESRVPSVPYEDLLATGPDFNEDDPRSVYRASLRWLRAYNRKDFEIGDRAISKARDQRATTIMEKLVAWKRCLLPERGYQEGTLSSLLAHDFEFRLLGGALAVQEEQLAWYNKITSSDSVDLFMGWFLYEQSVTGRSPCKSTDVVVRMLLDRLPDGSVHRKEVGSLLSHKRNQFWQLLEREENVEGAKI